MSLSHDATGRGPAVLLLHATVADRRMWDPQLPALADAGHRVIRPDLTGYGQTPVPERPYDEAREVIDLLDLLGVERTAIIGASGGGRVALEIATRWPHRVTALALLCTALAGHEPGPELRAFSEREDALLAAGDIAAATELNVGTWCGPYADEAVRTQVRRMQRHAFEVQMAAPQDVGPVRVGTDPATITAPTLLVSGGHDLPDFRRIAAGLAERIPGARHVDLDWAGHLPSLERPDVINSLLVDFLARV
jgi:3-oxoadipate enol-lactonase